MGPFNGSQRKDVTGVAVELVNVRFVAGIQDAIHDATGQQCWRRGVDIFQLKREARIVVAIIADMRIADVNLVVSGRQAEQNIFVRNGPGV